ncbi:MAG: type VI secretion system baseplate subunit TssG [Cellvibrionaceae bacterium]|nr:type VI secretion system baseplate subunit TssG [Cellvibrionaceae bacterium]
MSALSVSNKYDGKSEKERFFDLVRHYERHYKAGAIGSACASVGEDGPPSNEVVRFKPIHSLGCSLDVVNKLPGNKNQQDCYEFLVSFMGILGASGVLPQHYIKLSLERIKYRDHALVDFIGIFEHRLISLYYKAWSKYKFYIHYEFAKNEGDDNFSKTLRSLSGCFFKNNLQLYYAGHFSKNNRSLKNLKLIVEEVIAADITIQSMVGSWLPIDNQHRFLLGVNGRNNRLGDGVVLGYRYWDMQSKIIIRIKNIDMKKYLSLLPGKPLYSLLSMLVDNYVPTHISVDFEFKVNSCNKNIFSLGESCQLSRSAWLAGRYKKVFASKITLMR